MNFKMLLVSIGLIVSSYGLAADITCRGGDGPVSLINISHKFSKDLQLIPTEGEILDFVHWPRRKAIVYRNRQGQLRKTYYDSHQDKFVAQLNSALSPLVDPNEHFVLTNRSNWYLDAEDSHPTWGQFETNSQVTHLFWHHAFLGKTYLYSISNEAPNCHSRAQEISILKFTTGSVKPEKCHLNAAPGEFFYVGSGHVYPYVFLYKIFETAAGSYLSLYRIRVDSGSNSCKLEKLKSYPNPIPGEIQSVHQFREEDTFAVVTHLASTKKLFWDSPRTPGALCDFGRREPIILGERNPVVAGWEPSSGLTLMLPEEKAFGVVIPEKTKGELRRKDMKLSEDGNSLFLNLKGLDGTRELGEFRLD